MKISLLLAFLAPIIFLITRNPITGPWRLVLALIALVWLTADFFLVKRGGDQRKLFDVVLFGLFLVGATNWFFSPFFFLLYFLIMAITFVFTPAAGLGFTISLVLLFTFNVGEVDVAYLRDIGLFFKISSSSFSEKGVFETTRRSEKDIDSRKTCGGSQNDG